MRNCRLAVFFVAIICVAMFPKCSKVKNIELGATFPLTGDNALYGTNIKKGMDLAIEKINSSGGVGGTPISVIYLDDNNEPKQAVANLRRLISINHVPGVVGSAGSNCTLAMTPIANESKTVIISPTSSQSDISEAGPYIFRTCPSDAFQVKVVADWIREMNYNRIGILYVNNSWGLAMKDAFTQYFGDEAGEILIIEGVDEAQVDLRSVLTKITNAPVDALFMPTYSKQGGRAVLQAKELGINLPMFGCDPWDVGEFIEAAGDAAEGCMFTVFSQYEGKENKDFSTKFKAKYNEEPDFLAASGYDDAYILALGLRYVAAEGLPLTGENLQRALNRMPPYIGATGNNRFDDNGDVINKEFTRRIYRNGTSEEFGYK